MKNLFVLIFLLFSSFSAFAENENLFDKNLFQLDLFSLKTDNVYASQNIFNESHNSILTVPPRILFQYIYDQFVFRPIFYLNLDSIGSDGSIEIGKIWDHEFEFGIKTQLNLSENLYGKTGSKNGFMNSNLRIGPYIVFYQPFTSSNYLQYFGFVGYQYTSSKTYIEGNLSNPTDSKGITCEFEVTYGIHLKDNYTLAPHLSIKYNYTQDFGGSGSNKNEIELQIIPLSIQIII